METNTSKDLNNKGVQFFMNGDLEKAKNCYQKALETNPENATSLNNLGLLLHHEKSFTEAIENFSKAILIEKKPVYFLNAGNSHAMKGNLANAEKCYLEALNTDPNYYNAWISLAKLSNHQKKYEQAIRFWKKAFSIDPKPEYQLEIGKIYILVKDYESALTLLSGIQLVDSPAYWFLIGKCEYELRNHGLAEKAFKSALAIQPDSLEARQFLGLNNFATGKIDQCLEQYDFILKMYPSNHKMLTEKAVILCSISSFEKALTLVEKALTLKPDYPKAIHYKELILTSREAF